MTWEEAFRFSAAILTALGGGGLIVLSLSSWLGKVWATRILQKEQYELNVLRKEHEVRFAKLHVERAEAIKEMAQSLQKLEDALNSCLKNFQPVEEQEMGEKIKSAKRAHEELVELHKKNRIYFTKKTDDLIHRLALCSRDVYEDLNTYPADVNDIQYQLIPGFLEERNEQLEGTRRMFYGELTHMKTTLEEEFRVLLGIK